jgi:hypothetical protein
MDSLQNALNQYVFDTENADKNYTIAVEYEKLKQYAGAIGFYLRCAERTDDKLLAYTCLLKVGVCFEIQQGRPMTVRSMYKHAITLMPERPEAYFLLSRHYEWIKEYADSYMLAEIALNKCDFNLPPLPADVGYPGKYGLIFEKAVSAWWWGKAKECRQLFHLLADDYRDDMTEQHLLAVQNNLTNLGSGPESQAFRYYWKQHHDRLKFKFTDSEKIERNYSQVYQDMFTLAMLNGKKNGTYLEVGSADPMLGSNTLLLEQNYGWKGIGIEYKQEFVNRHIEHRKNPVLCQDATKTNYSKLLKELAVDGVVDYLQLDCEPSKTTFDILLMIPFEDYKFAVISYEHDHYVDVSRQYRTKSRRYLQAMGYKLVVNDVSPDGVSTFEDWWVHPDLIDVERLEMMMANDGKIKKIEDYFLSYK